MEAGGWITQPASCVKRIRAQHCRPGCGINNHVEAPPNQHQNANLVDLLALRLRLNFASRNSARLSSGLACSQNSGGVPFQRFLDAVVRSHLTASCVKRIRAQHYRPGCSIDNHVETAPETTPRRGEVSRWHRYPILLLRGRSEANGSRRGH